MYLNITLLYCIFISFFQALLFYSLFLIATSLTWIHTMGMNCASAEMHDGKVKGAKSMYSYSYTVLKAWVYIFVNGPVET